MRATLIYDGDCPMCRSAVAWIADRTVDADLQPLPCQSPERPARFPQLAEADCMRAMQLVMDDGTVHSGAAALPHLLQHIRGWRWLARVLRLPLIRAMAPIVYAFIARNRHTLSLVVREKTPNVECPGDACAPGPEPR